jgi:uncharacterized protein YbbK (DUF523 family)
MKTPPSIAVSACLLGEKVRYDGADKKMDSVLALASEFDLVALCPEVAIGLGIPRPTIGLFLINDQIHIRRHDDPGFDVTEQLHAYGQHQASQHYCGLILKARSPSCGIDDALILDAQGQPVGRGQGGFVKGLLSERSKLPMINEEQLGNAAMRQAFIKSVLAYAETLGKTP